MKNYRTQKLGALALAGAAMFSFGWAAHNQPEVHGLAPAPHVECGTFELDTELSCRLGNGTEVGHATLPAVMHHPGHLVITGLNCPTEDSCLVTWGEQPDGSYGYSVEEVTP